MSGFPSNLRAASRRSIPLLVAALLGGVGSLEAEPAFAPGQLLVRFKEAATSHEIETVGAANGLEVGKRLRRSARSPHRGPLVLFRSRGRSMAAIRAALARDPRVAYAEPNYTRTLSRVPNDADFELLWGLRNTGQTILGITGLAGADIGYVEAWDLARSAGSEVVVGVVDSGMSIRHPDLAANLWTHPAEIPGNGLDDDGNGRVDDVHGFDFGTDSPQMVDNDGHGTHVAGTIGAVSDNGIGISGVHGSAKLLPLKVESADGALYVSDIVEAFHYAADLRDSGVNLVALNASFGSNTFSQSEYDAIADLHAAGVILCAAAGNASADNDTTASYPANYALPNIIAVAASDQSNALASFSNYGSTTVDLAAPGTEIYSTLPLSQIFHESSLTVDGSDFSATTIEHAGTTPPGGLTAMVVACGLGFPADFPAGVAGNIALIERGALFFSEKVANAMAAGAIGVLIFDNVAPTTNPWTLGYEDDWIPALQLTLLVGQTIAAGLHLEATLVNTNDPSTAYQYLSGTSMATPHVTGAVAYAALNFPDDSLAERVARILDAVTPVPALAGSVATGGVLDLQRLADTDADTLPDWWEEDFFNGLARDGTGDHDGDGFSESDEFRSATDPTSGLSFFALEAVGYDPGDGTTLRFQSAPGRSYELLWSATLATPSWQLLADGIVGDGSVLEFLDPGATGPEPRFYRLRRVD